MKQCHRLGDCEVCSVIGAASASNGASQNVEGSFNLILICSSEMQVGCLTFPSHPLLLTDSLPNIVCSAVSRHSNVTFTQFSSPSLFSPELSSVACDDFGISSDLSLIYKS